jgi:tetratricopeptide (TPR) repeat protein
MQPANLVRIARRSRHVSPADLATLEWPRGAVAGGFPMPTSTIRFPVLPACLCIVLAGIASAQQRPNAAQAPPPQPHAHHGQRPAEPAGQTSASSGSHQHYKVAPEASLPSPTGALAPRLQNLGTHVFPVTTASERAQQFVSQGLNLSYAFNHAEAGRAFREAARLDPTCAMAYWGQALVLGPNINAAMDPKDEPTAHLLVKQAISLKAAASPREQALIDALAHRYSDRPGDRAERDLAYARAMKAVVDRFPDDLDVAALYVESVMDLQPWNYWTRDGEPRDGIADVVALTESIIARNPAHPGALHLYIHLMEAAHPERAVTAADRLLPLMPAAGHMVHMPSHIYQRVGRYDLAIKSNQLAVAADEDYITQCRAQGLYPMAYYPHNVHFLWFAATFDGQSALALEAARKVGAGVSDEMLAEMPLLAGFRVVPYYAMARFGRWDEILAQPQPPADSPFLVGAWHYVRGLALVARGRADEAERELQAVRALLHDKRLEAPLFSPNTAGAVLAIAPEVLAGEIAAARKDYDRAVAHLERAVRLDEGLVYTEPSEWHYPPRHALGAVLLEAGRPAEAETVYYDDLRRNPNNGWALFGVWKALEAQGKTDEAAFAERRFRQAWTRADVTLTASRLR